MANRTLRYATVLGLVVCSGCAAMQRTWDFEGATVATPFVEVRAINAQITQKTAYVTLVVENLDDVAHDIDLSDVRLSLPDGTEFEGETSHTKRAFNNAKNVLAKVGIGQAAEDAPIAPGATLEVRIAFRQYGRDFRRHPVLRIEVAGLTIDGEHVALGAVDLRAPSEAPMGEHI